MSQGKITKKQQEILEFIKDQILERGFPPAVREICEAVNLKSTSSVHSHLETLEKNGYIRRDPTKPRAIEILDDTFNLLLLFIRIWRRLRRMAILEEIRQNLVQLRYWTTHLT